MMVGVVVAGLVLAAGSAPAQMAVEHWGEQVIKNDSGDQDGHGDGDDAGRLTVEGDIVTKSSLGVGNTATNQPALTVTFTDDVAQSLYEIKMTAERIQAVFEWWDSMQAASQTLKMKLDDNNALTVFSMDWAGGSATDGTIVLTPATSGGSIITVDGQAVLVQGTGGDAYQTQAQADGRYVQTSSLSVSFGTGLVTDGTNQAVVGQYNQADDEDLFQVGNGADGNSRANALTVQEDGDVTVGRDLLVARNSLTNGDASVIGQLFVNPGGDLSMGSYTAGALPGMHGFSGHTLAFAQKLYAESGKLLSSDALAWYEELEDYLVNEGLWDHATLAVATSRYNAGTGNVIYRFGGYDAGGNDYVLGGTGTPAWSLGGFEFDGDAQQHMMWDLGGPIQTTVEPHLFIMGYLHFLDSPYPPDENFINPSSNYPSLGVKQNRLCALMGRVHRTDGHAFKQAGAEYNIGETPPLQTYTGYFTLNDEATQLPTINLYVGRDAEYTTNLESNSTGIKFSHNQQLGRTADMVGVAILHIVNHQVTDAQRRALNDLFEQLDLD
ncbi:MAG: hypothetical protein AAGK14_03930 [Verrucomicrobiota bacterium]